MLTPLWKANAGEGYQSRISNSSFLQPKNHHRGERKLGLSVKMAGSNFQGHKFILGKI